MAAHRLREVMGPDVEVLYFGFFFPSPRAAGMRMQWSREDLEAGRTILDQMCRLITAGAFLATDDADEDCRYCDYRPICGDVDAVAAASRRKLDNPENIVLQPLRELRRAPDA
jgi:hypothetical protein